MKDKIDLRLVGSLLKKQWQERTGSLKKGNLNLVGLIFRLILVGALLAVFIVFFGKFLNIYLSIKVQGKLDVTERLYEILTISYSIILLLLVVGGVSHISKAIFGADDIKLFSAMPVRPATLFFSKLIAIYLKQVVIASIIILPVNLVVAFHVPQTAWFYIMTILMCLLLPLVSLAIASLLSLPFHFIRLFLKDRFVLNFIVITAITAGLLYVYSLVLGAVKEMLLGDELRYFFDLGVMNGIALVARYLYPARWLAKFMLKLDRTRCGIGILIVLVLCAVVTLVLIKKLLGAVMQSRISGTSRYVYPKKQISKRSSPLASLIKKDATSILRTHSYMFSYFSIAIIMPLMVYFCMSVGSSLVTKLIGIDCNVELAIFLTLLFGSLTNYFCSTNISREGPMFYSIKAMPISYKSVFWSKIILCMIVAFVSELISAIVLCAAGYVSFGVCLFVLLLGLLASYSQICFATKYDFNHATFLMEEDGEIKENSNTSSVIMMLGILGSFLIGGLVLWVKMKTLLRQINLSYLTYIISGASLVIAAIAATLYLLIGLEKKYYNFSGGGI